MDRNGDLDSGNEPYFKLKSDAPIYARFESLTKAPLYIHGMKVLTSTNLPVLMTHQLILKLNLMVLPFLWERLQMCRFIQLPAYWPHRL